MIGLAGANFYARGGSAVFVTEDSDLFLPLDPDNLVRAWNCCEEVGLDLWSREEPLDSPHDRWLAERVVERRALTRATGDGLQVDLTLVMAGYEFETVWDDRRRFGVDAVEIPVARLLHIVTSKHAAGRDKDILYMSCRSPWHQVLYCAAMRVRAKPSFRAAAASRSSSVITSSEAGRPSAATNAAASCSESAARSGCTRRNRRAASRTASL